MAAGSSAWCRTMLANAAVHGAVPQGQARNIAHHKLNVGEAQGAEVLPGHPEHSRGAVYPDDPPDARGDPRGDEAGPRADFGDLRSPAHA